ncbi:MAG: hypothetical protein LIO44_07835 [Eubacterium sp.]|nr:hypothetical protein [Eubacterium sp.]
MVKGEIDMLKGLISEFDSVLSVELQDPEKLYELVNKANVLYSDVIPLITSQFEEIIQYQGLLVRNSKAIAELLRKFYIREEYNFEAGIMPLTYANLAICPTAQAVYKSGITKYTEKKYDRNILDDMRLALELLIKQILNNDKSLENQTNELGKKMSQCHTELKNLVTKNIDYLSKYQNHYIKHNDKVNAEEIDYIIEQTSAIINLLIKL